MRYIIRSLTTMKKHHHQPVTIVLPVIASILLGCGSPGLFIDLQETISQPAQKKQDCRLLVVRAFDNRQEVADKPLSYLGKLIVGNFNTYDVHVKDSVSLSEALTAAVGKKIAQNGINIAYFNRNRPVKAEINLALKGSDIGHIIYIEIRKYLAETMMQVETEWDIAIRLEDRSGNVLAKNESSGKKEVNANIMRPGKTSEEVIPALFRECIDSLVTTQFITSVKETL